MRTTSAVLHSEFTTATLRRKLRMCGSRTKSGHWYWCRNPACNRCRLYRANLVATNASYWSASQSGHALRGLSIWTTAFNDPANLLAGIHRVRRQLRGIFDRRQRRNYRWSNIKVFGFFTPRYDGHWSACFRGILHLGKLHEVTVLNAVEPLLPIRLEPIRRVPAETEIHAQMYHAVAGTWGLLPCTKDQIALWFSAVDKAGGYKSLVFRRGLQA